MYTSNLLHGSPMLPILVRNEEIVFEELIIVWVFLPFL